MRSSRWSFLLLVIRTTLVFCEVDVITELSGNVVSGANIFKCTCKMNEAIDVNGNCVPSSNPVPVWDYVKQKHFVVDISDFSSVKVNPVKCQSGYSKLNLSVSQFVIYTNGLLDNLILVDDLPSSSYCIDQILEPMGITLVAEVCQANPTVPICCPPGHVSNNHSECLSHPDDVLFSPTLIGAFSWTGFNLTEQNLQCLEGEVIKRELITLPNQVGASLVSYPLGAQLQWNSIYNDNSYFLSHSEYCVAVAESIHGWQYYAQFCVPDPKLQHIKACQNSTCVRKCCPFGFILDTLYATCVRSVDHQIGYTFIESDGQPMQEDPQAVTLVFGFPFCEELHVLSSDTKELDTLRFDSEGTLITVNNGNYSALDYCAEGLVFNATNPNSSVRNDAIICLKGFEEACGWRWIVSGVMLGISCIFCLLTLVVYLAIEDLRSKMVGKCLISQVSALLVAYLTLIFLQNVNNYHGVTCNFPGTVEHISILASFFWLNVMCYDMWSKISKMKVASYHTRGTSKKFLFYCLYAWGIPLFIGLLRVIIDVLPDSYDPSWLVKSNLGKTHCFFSGHFSDSAAKWLYLYFPILVLLLVNLGFFIHVAIVIRRTEKESAKVMAGSESSKSGKSISAKKEKARLYLKLFLVMGISWLLEIVMWVAVPENDCYFWGLDIVNMLQGVFIFVIFVCKKQTLKMVKEHFGFANLQSLAKEEIHLNEERRDKDEVGGSVAFDDPQAC